MNFFVITLLKWFLSFFPLCFPTNTIHFFTDDMVNRKILHKTLLDLLKIFH